MPKYYILILLASIFIFNCDKEDPLEIDIIILSTQTEKQWIFGVSEWQRVASIQYCAKNVGSTKINGWKVFFNVHLVDSPQLMAYEGIYYDLKPNDMTEARIVECIIPEYYGDAYKATLKHVETW